ncbi:MAG: MarC family protein [Hyphomicrobiales bacterium]
MTISAGELLLFAVSLLAMFSPPATLGPTATLIGDAPADVQRRIAFAVARNYAVVMLLTVALGQLALRALGISTGALTLTGGAALLHQGWPLMTRAGKASDREVDLAASEGDWRLLTTVPLTFPITIGGGTIAVAISAAGRYNTPEDLAALAGVALAMAVPVFLTLCFAGRLVRRLSDGAIDTVNRISGIILFALGAQLAVEGVRDLLGAAATNSAAAL